MSHRRPPAVHHVLTASRHYPDAEGVRVFADIRAGWKLHSYCLAAGMRSATVQGVYQDDYTITAGSDAFMAIGYVLVTGTPGG